MKLSASVSADLEAAAGSYSAAGALTAAALGLLQQGGAPWTIYMDPAVAYIWTPLWPLNRQKQRRGAFKTAPIYTFIGVGFADIGAFFDTIILQERFKALRQGPFKRVSTA